MSPSDWTSDKDRLLTELAEVDGLLNAQSATEAEILDFVVTFSELVKSASTLYKHATSQEKRRLAHLIFSELVVANGELASYTAKPEFRILLNRHSVQYGSERCTKREPK